MKQHKVKQDLQSSTEWSQNVSSTNLITLTVLRLTKGYLNYDGKWQENKKTKGNQGMESIKWKLQEIYKNSKGCGEINPSNTAGTRMGQKRHSNIYKNTTRNNRLEWEC